MINSTTTLRVARPTDRLSDVVRFYRDGVGLLEIGSFHDHDGFDGVMLGAPGASYHLEFIHQRGHVAGRAPTPENLLVFYLPKPKILVEADSYSPGPPDAPLPSPVPPNAVTLNDNIQRLKLNVATIAPIHGRGPVPMSEFTKFIAKRS